MRYLLTSLLCVLMLSLSAQTPVVGDYFEGGVVFWVNPDDNSQGLVCDIDDLGLAEYGCMDQEIIGADGIEIGTGMQNTIDIVNSNCSSSDGSPIAAEMCYDLIKNGFDDWFLPSKNELHELYINYQIINSVSNENGGTSMQTCVNGSVCVFRSSSESGPCCSWSVFSPLTWYAEYKIMPWYAVRAVRSYSFVSTPGCTNSEADNYDSSATIDDGSCVIAGCTNPAADNYNPDATEHDGSCISFGCLDSSACNFNENATEDDGSCDYTCCPGPGCCNEGTYWDEETQSCIVLNPSDSNFDGCVQLNDLLDLLSFYGICDDDGQVVSEEEIEGVFASACGDQTVVDIPVQAKYVISQGGSAPEYHRLMSSGAVVGDVKYVSWCVSYTNLSMNGLVYYQSLDSTQTWQSIGYCIRQDNGSVFCSEEALSQDGNTPGTAAPRHFKFKFTDNGWVAVENDILLID